MKKLNSLQSNKLINILFAICILIGATSTKSETVINVTSPPAYHYLHIDTFDSWDDAYNACRELGFLYEEDPYCRPITDRKKNVYFMRGGWWREAYLVFHMPNYYYPRFYITPDFVKSCPVGNPCHPATGNKTQTETDYVNNSGTLKVVRYYSSLDLGDGFSDLGYQWRHNYSKRLNGFNSVSYSNYKGVKSRLYDSQEDACQLGWSQILSGYNIYRYKLTGSVSLFRDGVCEVHHNNEIVAKLTIHNTMDNRLGIGAVNPIQSILDNSGRLYTFQSQNNQMVPFAPTGATLRQDGDNWVFTKPNGQIERFDSDGNLTSLSDSSARTTIFSYDISGKLSTVTDQFGNSLSYEYNEDGRLILIVTPDGNIDYSYDTKGRLSSVTYIDQTQRLYHYDNRTFPNHLTGITDENGNLFAEWEYDINGRVISSEHAGGTERVQLRYQNNGSTRVTEASGAVQIYFYDLIQGAFKLTHIDGDRCLTCSDSDTQAYTYDNNGFITSKTDWNGNTTTYTRDTQGRELSRTEASGTPQARTITTTWDTTLNKPLTVTDPEQITEYTYETEGRLLSRQQSPIQ